MFVYLTRGKIGKYTKSTGIFTKSVMKDLGVPKNLIESEIFGAYIYSPKMVVYEYMFSSPIFYQSDTLKFLNWLENECKKHGVIFFKNKTCNNIQIIDDKAVVENIDVKVVIIASGPLQRFFKGKKQELYTGLEYIAECDNIKNEHMFQAYFDYDICPGYFAWIAPRNHNTAHIGVLRKSGRISAINAMNSFLKKIKLKPKKIYEKRGGLVPLSGPTEPTYGNRIILLGDAAGQVGAFSSAGINYSVRAAKILGDLLPRILNDCSNEKLYLYEKKWKNEFGKLLNEELELKKIYNLANNNQKIEKGLKLLAKLPKNKIFEMIDKFSNMETLNYKTILFPIIPKIAFNYLKSKLHSFSAKN